MDFGNIFAITDLKHIIREQTSGDAQTKLLAWLKEFSNGFDAQQTKLETRVKAMKKEIENLHIKLKNSSDSKFLTELNLGRQNKRLESELERLQPEHGLFVARKPLKRSDILSADYCKV